MERTSEKLLRAFPIPRVLCSRIIGLLEQILVGLRSFHDLGRLARFVLLTGIIWFSDATATIVGMRALGFRMSLPLAFLLITGLGLGSALPATPGYVGVYQFVTVSVLTPFGFAKSDAIAYSFLSQAMQYVFFGFYGLVALSRQRGISLRSITEQSAA
jgi:glycosyltransferase 2 family protein